MRSKADPHRRLLILCSVFVGKYRGRKVAISEFREHLSESECLGLMVSEQGPDIVQWISANSSSWQSLVIPISSNSCVYLEGYIVELTVQRGVCIPEDSSQVPCMLVSELCENGDLFDYIVSRRVFWLSRMVLTGHSGTFLVLRPNDLLVAF
jgi:hypothetical protein